MSNLWISLSLLYVLQSCASSDDGVSLNCNKTVEVKAGDTVTLNCTIEWKLKNGNCKGYMYVWNNTDGIICSSNLTEYSCSWDEVTYVSLTILHAKKEENVTVEIYSDCGMAGSTIEVKIFADIRCQVAVALPTPASGPLHTLQPGDFVVVKDFRRKNCKARRWQGPFQVLLVTQTAVKVAERATWILASHCKKVSLQAKQ